MSRGRRAEPNCERDGSLPTGRRALSSGESPRSARRWVPCAGIGPRTTICQGGRFRAGWHPSLCLRPSRWCTQGRHFPRPYPYHLANPGRSLHPGESPSRLEPQNLDCPHRPHFLRSHHLPLESYSHSHPHFMYPDVHPPADPAATQAQSPHQQQPTAPTHRHPQPRVSPAQQVSHTMLSA